MAIKHLANISLEGNELQNAKLHPLGTAPSGAEGQVFYNTATNKLMAHNGTAWYSINGDVENVSIATGSTNMLTSTGGATPSIAAVTAAIANGGTGLATADQIYDFVAGEIAALPSGADTTYSVSVQAGAANTSIIRLTAGGSGSGNDDITINGGDNISISEAGEVITVQLTDDVTVAGDLVVTGDLTVSGSVTTVNTETISLADNIITLNSNETGTPSENAGIEVERGTADNTVLRFNEGTDRWEFTNDGTTYNKIPVLNEYNPNIGTSTNITTAGAVVIDDILLTGGVVTTHSTRTLTLADLGFNGDVDANEYVHPTLAGDDISIDTTALTGATIISDLDFNITTNTDGHVTDANGSVTTRELTPADIGAQVAGTYNPTIGTDTDVTVTGVNVIKSITMTDGVITATTTGAMQSASNTVKGLIELATTVEAAAGSDTTRAVTPAGLAAAIGDQLANANHQSFLIGDAVQTDLTITHTMASKNLTVQVIEESSGETVFAEVSRPTTATVIVGFASAPTSNQYRVNLIKAQY